VFDICIESEKTDIAYYISKYFTLAIFIFCFAMFCAVNSLNAFADFFDSLVGKGFFSKVDIYGPVKWGQNIDFLVFKKIVESNIWSSDLYMIELMPNHGEQEVLPNIAPFVKKFLQSSVRVRNKEITESSCYHFASLQAQTASLLYAFPYNDPKIDSKLYNLYIV